MRRLWTAAVFAVFGTGIIGGDPGPSHCAWGADAKAVSESKEQFERDVDQVAAASQEKAITKLSSLLKKYRNSHQEPILLARLADLQQQYAAILFRIAHGAAARAGKKPMTDIAAVNRVNKQAIATLTALITRYPDYDEIPHAYYMRGKAFEEIANKKFAAQDYRYLVEHYPAAEDAPAAYMSLAEFSIEANDHPKAITYLKNVEKLPENPYYPFALYKLAWSFYNLKNIPAALSYIERHVELFRKKQTGAVTGASSDLALHENSLMDAVTFFLEGYEQDLPQFRLTEAMGYFKRLDSGPTLGKMYSRFAKLLRSHDHETDLVTWKDQVLLNESERPESLDVLLTTYEYQHMKRRYPQLVESARDMVKLFGKSSAFPAFKNAQKLLLETAEGLHALILKNKANTEVRSLSVTLAAIYDAFTRIVDSSDPRVPRVHYNLAETLFAIKDYPGATEHYRWVVEHSAPDKWDSDSSLKAIAARYEVLHERQLTAKEITPRSFADNSTKALEPLLGEWINWLDIHAKHYFKTMKKSAKKPADRTEAFLFEANRALYAQGHILRSVERMKTFAEDHPSSEFAVPSASLVIDTYVTSAEWDKTNRLALDFLDEEAWEGTEFNKRLVVIAADSSYKLIENLYNAKDYAGVIRDSEKFFKSYSASARFSDCLSLAGRSALALSDKEAAGRFFTRLIAEAPNSENVPEALLGRGLLAEERYEFASAAKDYRAYLSLIGKTKSAGSKESEALRRKTLILTWLAADDAELRIALNTPAICTESLATECDRYFALNALTAADRAGSQPTTEDALGKVKDSSGENRTLWSAVALEGAKHLSFRDRLYLLRQVASGWEDADPLIKFTLIPYLSISIPRTFQINRMAMSSIAPLRANEKYITRRVEVIREMENAATKVMKLPWARIRAEVLNEIAALYIDLSRDLAKLPAPKNLAPEDLTAYEETIRKLVLPFEEKGQEMRGKAFEIASNFTIEEQSYARIAEPFFAENPSQAKSLKPPVTSAKTMERRFLLDLEFLMRFAPSDDWKADPNSKKLQKNPEGRIRALWTRAFQAKQWQQLAFFMREAHEKRLLPASTLSVLRALSLLSAGARGEGLLELDSARKDLDPKGLARMTLILIDYSVHALAHRRTHDLVKELPLEQLSTDESAFLASISWYESALSKKR